MTIQEQSRCAQEQGARPPSALELIRREYRRALQAHQGIGYQIQTLEEYIYSQAISVERTRCAEIVSMAALGFDNSKDVILARIRCGK